MKGDNYLNPVRGNEAIACCRCKRTEERDAGTGDMPDGWMRLMEMSKCLGPGTVLKSHYFCPVCRIEFDAFAGNPLP